jgi:hypothetical protein
MLVAAALWNVSFLCPSGFNLFNSEMEGLFTPAAGQSWGGVRECDFMINSRRVVFRVENERRIIGDEFVEEEIHVTGWLVLEDEVDDSIDVEDRMRIRALQVGLKYCLRVKVGEMKRALAMQTLVSCA